MRQTKILVVEDDAGTRQLMERHLRSAGYGVTVAANGREALDILVRDAHGIVITDLLMPEVGGLELCRAIRAHEGIPFVYLIVVSADGDENTLIAAFDAGANDFVVKPFRQNELLARLRAAERMVGLEQDLARKTREVFRNNAELAILNRQLESMNEQLNRMATTDALTNLVNRRAAMSRISEMWALAQRHGEALSCVMIDVDHFKSINDRFGHSAGDAVLKALAGVLRSTARVEDLVCRLGGEEFLVVCPRTDTEQAARAAERMRRDVEATPIHYLGNALGATISLGVASRLSGMHEPDEMLKLADEALYTAKREGRNRVCCSSAAEVRGAAPAVQRGANAETGEGPPRSDQPSAMLIGGAASRQECRCALERAGLAIMEFECDGPWSETMRDRPPQVVVVATSEPPAAGLTCVRRIRGNPVMHGVPVAVVTAGDAEADISVAIGCGADEVFVRPIRPAEFAARIRCLLQRSADRRELAESNQIRTKHSQMLSLLLDLSRTIAVSDQLGPIADRTVSVISELTGCRRVAALLPDGGGGLAVASAASAEASGSVALHDGFERWLAERVNASGERQILHTPQEVVALAMDDAAAAGAADYPLPLLAEPLSSSEYVVGVVLAAGRKGRNFAPHEVAFIDLVCNLSATAIHDVLARRSRDEARDSIVVALATLAEYRDNDTGRHLVRVTKFCRMLAEELRVASPYGDQIDDGFLSELERAVPLHDIGKVAVPDSILLKPGKLTARENRVMQTHTRIGYETLRSVAERVPGVGYLRMAEDIAHAHHEWFDGTGYPRGLHGQDIPLAARIVALADVYDALTNVRPYKEAYSHDRTVAIIAAASGTQFDPAVVAAFLRCERRIRELAVQLADAPARAPRPVGPSRPPSLVPAPATLASAGRAKEAAAEAE